jgi:hypothetical protein
VSIPAVENWTQVNGTSATPSNPGTYPNTLTYWSLIDAPASGPQGFAYTWRVPEDYVSGTSLTFRVLWCEHSLGSAEGNTWLPRLTYLRLVDGTTVTTASGTTTSGTPLVLDAIGTLKRFHADAFLTVSPASLAAGDGLRLTFDRLTTDANDNSTGTVGFMGISIEYVADM